jgi:tetratricopeptide (TPR) repeat protein
LAEVLIKKNNPDSAKKYLQLAEQLFDNSNCSTKNKYRFFSQSAELYFYQNNYEEALAYSLKMLEIATDENNFLRLAECNLRIANIFVKMSQSEKAKHYTLLARQSIDKLPESYKKYHLYNTLANRYNNLYQDFKDTKFLDTIEIFMSGIRSHAIKLGPFNRLLEQYYRKKAFLLLKTKNLERSLMYLDSALHIVRSFPMVGELYSINGDKANIYRKQKEYKKAEIFADSCLFFALKSNIISSTANAYDIIYMVAKDAGNSSKALWAFEKMTGINDSILSLKNTGKIAELEQKYNKAQNEKTIKSGNRN